MTAWIPDKLRFITCIQWWPPGYVPWMNITNHQGEESKQAVSFFYLENIIFVIIEEDNKQNQINTLHGQNSGWGQKSLRGQHGSPWEAGILRPLCPVWVDPGDSRAAQGSPGNLHLLTLDLTLLSFPLFSPKPKSKQEAKRKEQVSHSPSAPANGRASQKQLAKPSHAWSPCPEITEGK